MLCTIVGTLLHELGHVSVAKYFGYDTVLHYGSMHFYPPGKLKDSLYLERKRLIDEHSERIKKGEKLEELNKIKELGKKIALKYPRKPVEGFWVTVGGPTQTILTSLVGLCILFYRRSKHRNDFVFLDWLGVFLSLFILREVFNLLMAVKSLILSGSKNYNWDEFKISRYLGYGDWFLPIITCILGIAISLYIFFKVVPLKYRFTFLIAGFIGSILGFFFWFDFLGKYVFP